MPARERPNPDTSFYRIKRDAASSGALCRRLAYQAGEEGFLRLLIDFPVRRRLPGLELAVAELAEKLGVAAAV
jgi:hypothetical protein